MQTVEESASFRVLYQKVAPFSTATVQTGFDRAERAVHGLCDLVIGHALDVREDDAQALFLRQGREAALDGLAQFLAGHVGLGAFAGVNAPFVALQVGVGVDPLRKKMFLSPLTSVNYMLTATHGANAGVQ